MTAALGSAAAAAYDITTLKLRGECTNAELPDRRSFDGTYSMVLMLRCAVRWVYVVLGIVILDKMWPSKEEVGGDMPLKFSIQ